MKHHGIVASLVFGLALGGCSGGSSLTGGDSTASPGLTATQNALRPDPSLCPPADVRDGTNVYRIGPDSATAVKYQGTITDTVRECLLEGHSMRIRVGVEGRLVAGPSGGPGTLNLPVRMSLMTGINGTLVTSRLRSVPVTIGADGATTFSFVEDSISFALPSPDAIRDYVLFVGFDPHGRGAEAPAKRKKRR